MTTFKPALWDGSDPTYAPGQSQSDSHFYWKPPARYRKSGYSLTSVRLSGDTLERAAKCRDLTREMVRWYEDSKPKLTPGTWRALFAKYKADDVSPLRDVKGNTRKTYLTDLAYWEAVLGEAKISDMTFVEAKTMLRKMQERGRSAHFVSSKWNALRRFNNYGVALRWKECDEVQKILGQLRVPSPKARHVSPTENQVLAVIAAADADGATAFATGILFQWRLSLRAMDVRGDFIPLAQDEQPSGICSGRRRWGDGLTWDMISADLSLLTKTPSKTERSMPEAIVWDLTLTPDLQGRLSAVPVSQRIGPVIVQKHGMPFDRFTYGDAWRRYAKKAGVPSNIQLRDIRAGAANDAERNGATPLEIKKQLNHASLETTERYLRERSRGVNNVLRLRAGTEAKQA